MDNSRTHLKSVIAATLAAIVLLIAGGFAYRSLATRLARPAADPAIARGTLAKRFPARLGEWDGRDVPLDNALIRAAQADDYLNRVYIRRAGTETANLYISYGLRARDLMPHRPEVCYPASGWTLQEKRRTDLPLADGTRLDCHVFRFTRAGLGLESVTVLDYYLADGRIVADVSTLRARAWRGAAGIHRVAQIQITVFGGDGGQFDDTVARLCRFAALSGPAVRALFQDPSLRPAAAAR